MSLGLTLRLCKANTKEVGVQVNPRQDASVQCSLGPRTLLLRRRLAPGLPPLRPREQEQGSSATTSGRPVRFPRTIAVYSPMASRRLTTFLEEPEEAGQEAAEEEPEEEAAAAAEEEEQQRTEAAAVRASWEQPPGSSAEPQEPRPPQQQPPQQEVAEEAAAAAAAAPPQEGQQGAPERPAGQPQAAAPQEPEQGKTRLRFQVRARRVGSPRAAGGGKPRGGASGDWPRGCRDSLRRGRSSHCGQQGAGAGLPWLGAGSLPVAESPLFPLVSGAEVRLLPLQGLQHPLGERLRVVCAGHQQGRPGAPGAAPLPPGL